MATPIHTKRYLEEWNSVTIPSATADVQQQRDEAEVTTSSDSEKQYLPGKASATGASAGPADWAASGGIATLWDGIINATQATRTTRPDGTSAKAATNPSAEGSAFLTSLQINYDQGNAGQYSAAYRFASGLPSKVTS